MVQAKHPQLHDHILQHPALYRARGSGYPYRPCGAVATTGVFQDPTPKNRADLPTISQTKDGHRKGFEEVKSEL